MDVMEIHSRKALRAYAGSDRPLAGHRKVCEEIRRGRGAEKTAREERRKQRLYAYSAGFDLDSELLIYEVNEVWKSCTDETMSGHGRSLREALRKIEGLRDEVDELMQAVSDLKLDYKEAQEAANSVNDYASSLMNIFNYEPMEAAKKARNGGKAE